MLTEAELNPNDVRRLRMTLAHSFPDLQVIRLLYPAEFLERIY